MISIPYKTNADLPDGIRENLPGEAQTVYRTVFNDNEDKGESNAAKIAWTAVKNGWEKNSDGKWVRKETVTKTADVRIIQKAEKERYTLGIVYEPDTVDSQGDWSTAEEIQKACHNFMRALQGKSAVAKAATELLREILKAAESDGSFQVDLTALAEEIEKAGGPLNDMHETDFQGTTPDVVECYIAPVDFMIGEQTVKKGTWLMGVVWPTDYFNLIESGDRTGYSMEGTGRRVKEDAPQAG